MPSAAEGQKGISSDKQWDSKQQTKLGLHFPAGHDKEGTTHFLFNLSRKKR